jgi:hypothetical protein
MLYQDQLKYYDKLKVILGMLTSSETPFTIKDVYHLLLNRTKCENLKKVKANQLYLHNLIFKYFASNKLRREFYVVDKLPNTEKISYLYYSVNNRADLINYDSAESWDESNFKLELSSNVYILPIIYFIHTKCMSNKFDDFTINFDLISIDKELNTYYIARKNYVDLFNNYRKISNYSFKENIIKRNALIEMPNTNKSTWTLSLSVSHDSSLIKLHR